MQGGQKQVTEVVAELTGKISELKKQILANEMVKQSQKKSALRFGSLAISIVMYGLVSNVPAAGVGSLAALIATLLHLRDRENEAEEEESRIITSPAYALLKARDLLNCRESE
jgi:hypothetical protein